VWIALALVSFFRGAARAQEPSRIEDRPAGETYRFEVLAGYWSPRTNIIVSSDAPGVPGTRIDLRNDVGLTDERFLELQLSWRPAPKHKFRFQYLPVHVESAATAPRDLLFDGATYRAGQPVAESLDWTTYRFGYEYDFILERWGNVGVIAEVRHTVVRAALQTTLIGQESRQAMPVPAAGGIVRVYPAPRLSLTGEMSFFGVPDRPDGHYGGHIADVDASATWSITRHVGAQGGFRMIDINHLGEWNTATFALKGAYVAALVRY
jgi:hypothetical protein